MSTERTIVVDSYVPRNRCGITWKIHNISSFNALSYNPLRYGPFSTKEHDWRLDMYVHHECNGRGLEQTWCHSIRFDLYLLSPTATRNVHCELSILINGRKYFTKVTRPYQAINKDQHFNVWDIEQQSVLDLLKEHGVKDDVLVFDINVETWEEDTTETINWLEDKPHYNLINMLTDQVLTDVTLKVKDKEFKAHKVILAAASPVFKAMFKEGTKEHQENYVNIQDVGSDIFEVFLRFLYSGQVDQLDDMVSDLLVTADKYDVQPLKKICAQHIAKNISLDNVVDILTLADRYDVELIKLQAQKFITNNRCDENRYIGISSWNLLQGC